MQPAKQVTKFKKSTHHSATRAPGLSPTPDQSHPYRICVTLYTYAVTQLCSQNVSYPRSIGATIGIIVKQSC